jgi:hypothetical protein
MVYDIRELKSLASLAAHFPRQDGSGKIGVKKPTMHSYINRGTIKFEKVRIESSVFYIIPLEDQQEKDWKLGLRYHPKVMGQPSIKSKIGLESGYKYPVRY